MDALVRDRQLRMLGIELRAVPDSSLDEDSAALVWALEELAGEHDETRDAAFEGKHHRGPGGKFSTMFDRLVNALKEHKASGKSEPFAGFDREQLRRVAKARGIELKRGATHKEISDALVAHIGDKGVGKTDVGKAASLEGRIASATTGRASLRSVPYNADTEDGLTWGVADFAGTGLSGSQVSDATASYGNNGYEPVNFGLRKARGNLDKVPLEQRGIGYTRERTLGVIRGVDAAMSVSALTDDVLVHRGVVDPAKTFGRAWRGGKADLGGLEWVDHGFVSTSAEDGRLGHFAGSAGVQMRIVVPRGTHAIGVDQTSGGTNEHELLLDRGLHFRVVNDSGPGTQPRHLDIEVLPTADAKPTRPTAPRKTAQRPKKSAARPLDGIFESNPVEIQRKLAPVFEGSHAGLSTHISSVLVDMPGTPEHTVRVRGQIRDAAGTKVGNFTRNFTRESDGSLIANHDKLLINEDLRAAGFATSFNRNALDHYRKSGVSKVTLEAGSDVGGYAWARAGYAWADQDSADGIQQRMVFFLGRLRKDKPTLDLPGESEFFAGSNVGAQIEAARAMVRRMNGKITDPSYPTPFEISQLGRWSGAGKDDRWIGKHVLLGSAWFGELHL